MAEDNYANSKCFILSPDGYEEITYSELCRWRDTDETYRTKKFIPLHGMLMEVTPEQYIDFYRIRNRQRYLDKRSAEKGDISIDMLTTPEFNGADILVSGEDVAEQVANRIMLDKLRDSLGLLTAEEVELIRDVFYNGVTERDLAVKHGVSQVAIHKRKRRILEKLRKLLES